MFWLSIFIVSFPSFGWAFSYPDTAATPDRQKTLNENLQGKYYDELREIKKSLRGDQKSTFFLEQLSSEIKLRNKKFSEELHLEALPPQEKNGGARLISKAQAQKILDTVSTHPIVSDAGVAKYDRERLNVGFCFGRAAYFHIELLRRGLNPKSIGKVFAIGNFLYNNAAWNFHVTTVARGPQNEWWTLDPVTSKKVEPLDVWMSNVTQLDRNPAYPQVRFYFTDAVKFQPLAGAYSPKTLFLPYFHNYFVDLAKWFDENPVPQLEQFGAS